MAVIPDATVVIDTPGLLDIEAVVIGEVVVEVQDRAEVEKSTNVSHCAHNNEKQIRSERQGGKRTYPDGFYGCRKYIVKYV